MKKMMFYLVFFSLMAACKKPPSVSVDCNSPTNDSALCKELIVGKWEWQYEKVQTRGTPTYFVTLKDKGYTQQMVFNSDGKVFNYQNNALKEQGFFRLASRKEFTLTSLDSALNVIVIETSDKKVSNVLDFKICSDSLYLLVTNHSFESWSKQ